MCYYLFQQKTRMQILLTNKVQEKNKTITTTLLEILINIREISNERNNISNYYTLNISISTSSASTIFSLLIYQPKILWKNFV